MVHFSFRYHYTDRQRTCQFIFWQRRDARQHRKEPWGYSSSKRVSMGGAISAARRPKVYQQMSKTEVTVIQALCHRAALCFLLGQGLQRLAKLSPVMGSAADYCNSFREVIVPRDYIECRFLPRQRYLQFLAPGNEPIPDLKGIVYSSFHIHQAADIA